MHFTDEQIVKIIVSHVREVFYSPEKTSNALMMLRVLDECFNHPDYLEIVQRLEEINETDFPNDVKRLIYMLEYSKKI